MMLQLMKLALGKGNQNSARVREKGDMGGGEGEGVVCMRVELKKRR